LIGINVSACSAGHGDHRSRAVQAATAAGVQAFGY